MTTNDNEYKQNNDSQDIINRILETHYGKNRTLFFVFTASLSILFFSLFFHYKPTPPDYIQAILYLLPTLIGVTATLCFVTPGKLEKELIQDTIGAILTKLSEGVIAGNNSTTVTIDTSKCEKYIEMLHYTIRHITGSVYLQSKEILARVNPSKVKIVMKAREFSLDTTRDNSDVNHNSEALDWFNHLNNYVSQYNARSYVRVIALNPKDRSEAERDIIWINDMIEILSANNTRNCEIKIAFRDITLSCVLLDDSTSFFAFLIGNSFNNFMEISSKTARTLNCGINDWFDGKFNDSDDVFSVYKIGKRNNANLAKITEKLDQTFGVAI